MMQFCRRTERLFGKHAITPNMHLHAHLLKCIVDYGPLYVFWCFAFERYNGILGSMPTNNKCIESQLMKKFLMENAAITYTQKDEFTNHLLPLFPKKVDTRSYAETIAESSAKASQLFLLKSTSCLLYIKISIHFWSKTAFNTWLYTLASAHRTAAYE